MDTELHNISNNGSSSKPDISISFVNYNSTGFLEECLKSVDEYSNGLNVEVLITDNASANFDPGKIHQMIPHAVITVNQENRGFAYAHNQNFSLSKADFFLLLNPDTIITRGFFHAILETFRRFKDVAVVAPNLVSKSGESLDNVKGFPTMKSAMFELLFFDAGSPKRMVANPTHDNVALRYVDCITGAAFAVRSCAYRALGGLDPRFFMYFEEVDFCRRVRGIPDRKIVILPWIKVLHYHGRSSIQTDVRQTVYYESYYWYFRKHYGLLPSLVIRGLIIINTVAKMFGIQVKYFPLRKGWQEYSRKTLSAVRLLFWSLGLRESSRGFSL